MTVTVEDGTGVNSANSYVDAAFVTAYLTDRNRVTENSWSTVGAPTQDGSVVAATDFIEQRWGLRFMGIREFRDISAARGTLTLTAQPSAAEIVTIGTTVFTFGTNVTIGADVAETIDNLVTAVLAHPDVTAKAGVGDTMIVEAKEKGTPGNVVVTTTDVVGAAWTAATLQGGSDVVVEQPLSFPRLNLFSRSGVTVRGIPAKLQFATAEYAVRAAGAVLMPDPVIDASGRTVVGKREKVGPIEVETKFEEGGALSQLIHSFPAADRLLAEYVASTGRVIRG